MCETLWPIVLLEQLSAFVGTHPGADMVIFIVFVFGGAYLLDLIKTIKRTQ